MRLNYLVFGAFFSLAPAVADVIDVTVSGNFSGSGNIDALCFDGCGDDVDFESFTFSKSNDQVGTVSGSASTTTDDERVSLSGSIQQTTSTSTTSIGVDLQTSTTVDAAGGAWAADFESSDVYEVTFTLTTESLMDLTLQDTGDGFERSCVVSILNAESFCPASATQDLLLSPGTYTLGVNQAFEAEFSPEGIGTQETDAGKLTLTADFTAAVPEPTSLVMGSIAIAAAGLVFARRRFLSA